MSLLRALAALALALVLQAGLGRLWPGSHRFVDVLLVPVVLYGAAGKQRSAMLIGCATGLLGDTWFQVGTLGVNGFKRTLVGWILGGVATRLDMGHRAGWLLAGAAVSLADDLLDLALKWLLDQPPHLGHPAGIAVRAVTTGLLAMLAGGILDRVSGAERGRKFA